MLLSIKKKTTKTITQTIKNKFILNSYTRLTFVDLFFVIVVAITVVFLLTYAHRVNSFPFNLT